MSAVHRETEKESQLRLTSPQVALNVHIKGTMICFHVSARTIPLAVCNRSFVLPPPQLPPPVSKNN